MKHLTLRPSLCAMPDPAEYHDLFRMTSLCSERCAAFDPNAAHRATLNIPYLGNLTNLQNSLTSEPRVVLQTLFKSSTVRATILLGNSHPASSLYSSFSSFPSSSSSSSSTSSSSCSKSSSSSSSKSSSPFHETLAVAHFFAFSGSESDTGRP